MGHKHCLISRALVNCWTTWDYCVPVDLPSKKACSQWVSWGEIKHEKKDPCTKNISQLTFVFHGSLIL